MSHQATLDRRAPDADDDNIKACPNCEGVEPYRAGCEVCDGSGEVAVTDADIAESIQAAAEARYDAIQNR